MLNNFYLSVISASQFRLQHIMAQLRDDMKTGQQDTIDGGPIDTASNVSTQDSVRNIMVHELETLGVSEADIESRRAIIVDSIVELTNGAVGDAAEEDLGSQADRTHRKRFLSYFSCPNHWSGASTLFNRIRGVHTAERSDSGGPPRRLTGSNGRKRVCHCSKGCVANMKLTLDQDRQKDWQKFFATFIPAHRVPAEEAQKTVRTRPTRAASAQYTSLKSKIQLWKPSTRSQAKRHFV